MDPREKLAADLELLKPVADHVAYWSCGLIAGQSLTLGDLRALLAEPKPTPILDIAIPISDALRQIEAALSDTLTNYDCRIPGCSDCQRLKECLALLPALAQQMVEGERFARQLVKQSEVDRESTEAKLAKTWEALAVAEGALRKAVYELNTIRARDGVPWTGVPYPMPTDVVEEYFSSVVDECFAALARIAALSPTGTPKGEKG